MNFQKFGDRTNAKQKFDKKEIFVIKAGQKINCYDAIQAAKDGTDIYDTLAKTGKVNVLDLQPIKENFTEMLTLKDILNKKIKAQNIWLGLPLEVRRQFDHSQEKFLQNGENWLKEKEKEENQKRKNNQEKKDIEIQKYKNKIKKSAEEIEIPTKTEVK